MNEMMIKEFNGKQVRTHIDESGKVWFSTQDLVDILGIKYRNSAMKRISDAERGGFRCSTPGGIQEISAVNESGMYKLILRSDKPNADKLIQWVTEDVLPSIRKTGSYSIEKKQMTPAEQLLILAQRAVDTERAIVAANKEIKMIETEVTRVDKRVDKIDTTMNQLLMHRKGNDPTPAGTIPTKRIRQRYFFGISDDVIREYLTEKNHPKVPYTYVGDNGSDHSSFAWVETGLKDLYEEMIVTSEYIKTTPHRITFTNPLISNNFCIKKADLPPKYKMMIDIKINNETMPMFTQNNKQ